MKLIKEFFKLQKKLHEYFGYNEDWCVFSMQDYTDVWWSIPDESHDKVSSEMPDGQIIQFEYEQNLYFTNNREHHIKLIENKWNWEKANIGDFCYHYEIYHQRFLDSAIFKGEDYTMMLVDTHTDGNKYLVILDNKKELNKKSVRKDKIENLKSLGVTI